MTAAEVKSMPWGLWWTQVLAVMRLELKKSFLNRRSLWIYGAALAPVALTAGHSVATIYIEQMAHRLETDTKAFAGIFQFAYLRMGLFFGCALLFTNLFSGEMLNKTLHYYFLTPMRREVLAAGKYLSGLVAAVALFAGSVGLAHVTTYMHFGPQAEDFYFAGPGLSHLFWYMGVAALACVGYGAVFTVMGLLFRNPLIPAAVVMVWETINAFLPPLLKKFSVIFYLKSMCPVDVPVEGGMALFVQEAEAAPPWLTIPGLLLLSLLTLVYAGYRARKTEISYAE